MHPRLEELFAYLKVRRAALHAAVETVPEGLRNQPPSAGRWSVAEVLEHLALVERRFTTTFADRLVEAKAAGLAAESDTSPIVGSYDVAPLLDRRDKHAAPDVVVPHDAEWQAAWDALEAARKAFLEVYLNGDGLALGDVINRHPRIGALNLYQWGVWIGGHEARHTEQVREIAAELTSAR